MGRQAFLTRLALGRSAFEPLASESSQEGDVEPPKEDEPAPRSISKDEHEAEQSSIIESPKEGSLIDRSSNYEQQYDMKGYPENRSSKDLKKRWRRAINDVLATLGICVAKGRESVPLFGAHDLPQILELRYENKYGTFISITDCLLQFGCECSSMALRQRLQTFKFYSGMALSEIIKSEWSHFGGLRYLLSGIFANSVLLILDTGIRIATSYIFEALRSATDGSLARGSRFEELKDIAIDNAEVLTKLVLIALIAPLEVYATLQRLDLSPAWPLFPHPRAYIQMLLAISGEVRWSGIPNSLVFSPLIYIWLRRNNGIELKMFEYIWAFLPKPTRPDRISVISAAMDEYNSFGIIGLAEQNDPDEEWISSTVVGHLAYDLRSIGRSWQMFYDRCVRASSWSNSTSRSSNLADCIRRDQALLNNPRMELAQPSTAATNPGSHGQNSHHDPPNNITPPLHSPSNSQSHPSTPSLPFQSNRSSASPSPPASPRPIELTSHNENGEVHVSLTLPTVTGMTQHPPMVESALQAPAATGLPNSPALPESAPGPNEARDIVMDVARTLGLKPVAGYRYHNGLEHRVTALSVYPAESMALRLSSLFMTILCLPFESLFVRSVAILFLSSPSRSPASAAAAARWKSEIYSPRTWFGAGLSAGGWKGVGDYVGKMILVQALEFGVGFVTWQVGMGVVWWVRRTWCGWKRTKSTILVRESRRVQ